MAMTPSHKASKLSPDSELLGIPKKDLRLRVRGPQQPVRILRVRASKCTVGSAPDCVLRIPEPQVQPLQCMLLRGARGNFVRWLNTETSPRHAFRDSALQHGDRLQVGSFELEVLDAPTTTSSVSPTTRAEDAVAAPLATMTSVEVIESRMQRLEEQLAQLHRQSGQDESDNLRKTVDRLASELDNERERHRRERENLFSERQRLSSELDH